MSLLPPLDGVKGNPPPSRFTFVLRSTVLQVITIGSTTTKFYDECDFGGFGLLRLENML